MTDHNFLEQIYFDPSHPGAFAGPTKLLSILKKHGRPASLKGIKEWLQNQDAYSLLRPVHYRFKRSRVIPTGIDGLWDADLADVSNISQHNDGIKFWLIAIDVFSRHVWVIPTKSKHHTQMVESFKQLFSMTSRRPTQLRTDNGMEFKNRAVQKLLQNENIRHFTTKNTTKANYAERVIRTIKGLVYRYFIHRQTYKYSDVLPQLVSNYNRRPHRSLHGLAPAEITKTNEAVVWKKMYVDTSENTVKKRGEHKFKINDQVRISHLKYTFQRDYQQKWTEEIFKIYKRFRKSGLNVYALKDLLNEVVEGFFYEKELQKISKDLNIAHFRVENVVRTRKRRNKTEHLIKWMGWPTKFNSWVTDDDIQKY